MRLRDFVAAAALCVLYVSSAAAAGLPVPKVDYTAVRVMESEQGTFSQVVFHSGGKERAEMDMGGMKMVTILRPDRNLVWSLMLDQQMYMEMDVASARARGQASAPPDDVEITEVGADTVDGQPTTKYKLIMKDKSAGGFVWFTADNIPVKMEFLSKEGGQKTRIKMTLQNVKVGALDPRLFEVPAGFEKMPAVGGFNPGMMRGR